VAYVEGAATGTGRRVAHPAPLTRRFAAWILDQALVLLPVVVAQVAGAPDVIVVLLFIASIVIAIANSLVLVVRTGQSLGRRVFAVKVLDSNRMTPPGVWQVIWRDAVGGPGFGLPWRPISALPGLIVVLGPWPLICYGAVWFDQRWRRGVHDRWSHTVVVDAHA
jgi:hypothetical protein